VPAYRARALVLKKTKLGETDTIVTALSADGRQIRAVVKGARGARSRLGGRLEPYTVTDLMLHSGRTLDIVSEAETVRSNEAVCGELDRSVAASAVCDTLEKLTAEADEQPVLFELGVATLETIGEGRSDALPALVTAFLVKAMAMTGLRPSLAVCARCACEEADGLVFSPAAGGALCVECGPIEPRTLEMPCDVRDALDALLRARMSEVEGLEIDPAVQRDSLRLMRAFVHEHVHGRLRALEVVWGMYADGTWPEAAEGPASHIDP
jgi:DNA repair protein RecO (recombination protein O)